MFVALASLIAGGTLIGLAAPRLAAEIVGLPGNSILVRAQRGERVAPREADTLAESRRRKIAWTDSGEAWSEIGIAELLRARQEESPEERRQRLLAAIASTRAGLERAPVDPFAWLRLAAVELDANGASVRVARALETSIRTGPFEPLLTAARLELCLVTWDYFTSASYSFLYREVRLAWLRSREEVVRIARRTGRAEVVRTLMAPYPDELAAFEDLLVRLPR